MKKAERVQFILDTLEQYYPETPIPLNHTDPYTLLRRNPTNHQTLWPIAHEK